MGAATGTTSAGSPATSRARSEVEVEETTTKDQLEMETQTSMLELDLKFLISRATILKGPAMVSCLVYLNDCINYKALKVFKITIFYEKDFLMSQALIQIKETLK